MPLEALLLETDAPTCRCKASRGGEHAGQPADHSPLVGTIAAATAGGCYFGVT
jgi:Tat protein secretion system quality control protein TatD with DNase activity